MKKLIYVPGLSESVEEELKKKEAQEKANKPEVTKSKTGAQKRYVTNYDRGKLRTHRVDDRSVQIPPWEKYALTLKEAAEYYSIAESRFKSFVSEHPEESFVLKAGSRFLIKRRLFEEFLDENGEF